MRIHSLLVLVLLLPTLIYGQTFNLNQDEIDFLYNGNKGRLYPDSGMWDWKGKVLIRSKEVGSSFYKMDELYEAMRSLNGSNEVFEFVHQFYAVDPINALGLIERHMENNLATETQAEELKRAIDYYAKSWYYRGKDFGGPEAYVTILKSLKTESEVDRFMKWWVRKEPDATDKLSKLWNTNRFDWPPQVRSGVYHQLSQVGCSFHFL